MDSSWSVPARFTEDVLQIGCPDKRLRISIPGGEKGFDGLYHLWNADKSTAPIAFPLTPQTTAPPGSANSNWWDEVGHKTADGFSARPHLRCLVRAVIVQQQSAVAAPPGNHGPPAAGISGTPDGGVGLALPDHLAVQQT